MKDPADVVDGMRKAQGEQQQRIANYERYRNAYFGISGGAQNTMMDTTGRPILRMQDLRSELRQRRGAPNLVQPIVDDFVALKGTIPLMRVLPEDETEEAMNRAQLRTYAIRHIWERSQMDVQQINAAFYLSCLGDVLYTLDPVLPNDADELSPAGVYITVYSPGLAFHRFRKGRFSQELSELWLTWSMGRDACEEEYGYTPKGDDAEVVIYYNKDEKQIIIDEDRVSSVTHNLGFVPAQWVRNKVVGDQDGQADISQAVDVHEEIQSIFLILGDALIESVYAPFKIRDAENVEGDTLTIGPRAVISVTGTGDVTRVEPAPPPTAASQLLETMQQALYHITGTAPVRVEGDKKGANISGRMVHAIQQPQEARMGIGQTILGYGFEWLNQKALLMYGKIPELAETEVNLHGSHKGKPYSLTTKGKDLGGMSRIEIKWDALIGSTKHERLVMALQAFAQGLVAPTYVIEQLGESDPMDMLKRSALERQLMASLQPQPPQGPPGQEGASTGHGGGDPGQQQQDIMQPAQGGAAGMAGGNPGGGPSAGPQQGQGATLSTPGPAQPGPPQGTVPLFGPQANSPTDQGAGPAPTTPDIMGLIQQAISSLPADVQNDIVGLPMMEGGELVVRVTDAKHIPRGQIKRAFSAMPFPVRVRVAA